MESLNTQYEMPSIDERLQVFLMMCLNLREISVKHTQVPGG